MNFTEMISDFNDKIDLVKKEDEAFKAFLFKSNDLFHKTITLKIDDYFDYFMEHIGLNYFKNKVLNNIIFQYFLYYCLNEGLSNQKLLILISHDVSLLSLKQLEMILTNPLNNTEINNYLLKHRMNAQNKYLFYASSYSPQSLLLEWFRNHNKIRPNIQEYRSILKNRKCPLKILEGLYTNISLLIQNGPNSNSFSSYEGNEIIINIIMHKNASADLLDNIYYSNIKNNFFGQICVYFLANPNTNCKIINELMDIFKNSPLDYEKALLYMSYNELIESHHLQSILDYNYKNSIRPSYETIITNPHCSTEQLWQIINLDPRLRDKIKTHPNYQSNAEYILNKMKSSK